MYNMYIYIYTCYICLYTYTIYQYTSRIIKYTCLLQDIHTHIDCLYVYVYIYIYISTTWNTPQQKNQGKGEEKPSQSHRPTSCNLAMTIGSFKCFSASEPVHPTKSPELFGAEAVSGDSPGKLKHHQREVAFRINHGCGWDIIGATNR